MDTFHEKYPTFLQTIISMMVMTFPLIDSDEKKKKASEIIRPFIDLMFQNDIRHNIEPNIELYIQLFKEFMRQVYTERITFETLCHRMEKKIVEILKWHEDLRDEAHESYCCDRCSSFYVPIKLTLYEIYNFGDEYYMGEDEYNPSALYDDSYLYRSMFPVWMTRYQIAKIFSEKKTLNEENFLKKQFKHLKDIERHSRNKGEITGNRHKRVQDSGKSKMIGNFGKSTKIGFV